MTTHMKCRVAFDVCLIVYRVAPLSSARKPQMSGKKSSWPGSIELLKGSRGGMRNSCSRLSLVSLGQYRAVLQGSRPYLDMGLSFIARLLCSYDALHHLSLIACSLCLAVSL